jgi:hypothetical protein
VQKQFLDLGCGQSANALLDNVISLFGTNQENHETLGDRVHKMEAESVTKQATLEMLQVTAMRNFLSNPGINTSVWLFGAKRPNTNRWKQC